MRAYQLVILRCVLFPSLFKLPLLSFETPPLHLLICHELQGAISDSNESKNGATVKAGDTFCAVDRSKSICANTYESKRGANGDRAYPIDRDMP